MGRQLPKNVRQIGNVSDSSKIYVEDYVDTFFNQLCEKAGQEMTGAFLVGEKIQEEEQDYIYVYGAIRMQELKKKGKDFFIEESVWKNACETCKEYFGNAEILGWFIAGGEHPLEVNHNINKIHQKYFQREKSIFVTKNARDKEEKFYVYKYKELMECGGHFVYYEKNLEMQNYMIASRKRVGITPSEIIEDRVTKNFRSIIQEKIDKNEQKTRSRLVYVSSTFLILVILIIGVTMLDNYDKMKNVENSLSEISETVAKREEESVETSGQIVEQEEPVVPEPLEETKEEPTVSQTQDEKDEETVEGTIQTEDIYIVEKGDTLVTISKKVYGDSAHVDAICKMNGLEDGNLIFIGQKLMLP